MTATDRLKNLATSPNGFAFDAITGASYQLSGLGLEIIAWIRDGVERGEILCRIMDGYDVDEHTADRDLVLFLSSLRSLGLLEP